MWPHKVHKTLPVAPLGSRGLQEQCNLCRRLGPDTFHESQPPRPIREPQFVPAVLVDCSLGGTRQRLGRTVCLIDTSALGRDSPLDNPRNLYCGIDDTVEVLNVASAE